MQDIPPIENKPSQQQLDELRVLCTGLKHDELQKLYEWLRQKDARAQSLAEVLPLAVEQRLKQDEQLTQALLPLIESAIYSSVRDNPEALADALFPVMGPAIRRSISETFRKMLEGLNETLETAFSFRRISWRVQAAMSGKSYAELVLLNGMQYRVKYVFLIHRETGLLLNQAEDESGSFDSADMVSGMLTAIQDFVKDSFKGEIDDREGLDSIRLGDLSVLIEQGPFAYLAIVVQGEIQSELRDMLHTNLESIHRMFALKLKDFNGDTSAFEDAFPVLEDCLVKKGKKAKKKKKGPIYAIVSLAILLVLFLSYFYWQKGKQWQKLLKDLDNQHGIELVQADYSNRSDLLKVLKDPLASDTVSDQLKQAFDVELRFIPFISLDSAIIYKRACLKLNPPETIVLSFHKGQLRAKGSCSAQWRNHFLNSAELIPGVDTRIAEVHDIYLDSLILLAQEIKFLHIKFDFAVSALSNIQKQSLDSLMLVFDKALHYSQKGWHSIALDLSVSQDTIGDAQENKRFAMQRRENVRAYLQQNGFDEAFLFFNEINPDSMQRYPPRMVNFVLDYRIKEK